MRCDECGYDWEGDGPEELAAAMAGFGRRYQPPLTRFLPAEDPDEVVRRRPQPGTWSALEYAVHVAVVFDFYRERIDRVVSEDRPQLQGYGFGEAADRDHYNDRDRQEAAADVARAAGALAECLSSLDASDWARAGIGSGGGERTVARLARSAVHEGHHHLLDIGRVLRRVRGR